MRTPVLVFASTLLVLAGCTLNTDYFADYRGRNLLANYDFDDLDGATPKWTSTTVGLNAVAPANVYMTWSQSTDLNGIGDGSVSDLDVGPDGVSPAFRLEIKNLVPDGDFENGGEVPLAVGGTAFLGVPAGNGWSSTAGGDPWYRFSIAHATNGQPASLINFAPNLTLDNRSLLFASQLDGESVRLSLNVALGALWLEGQYRLRFDVINASGSISLGVRLRDGLGDPLLALDADNGGDWSLNGLSPGSTPVAETVSQTFTVGAGLAARNLVVGASAGNARDAAILDNVRVLPATIDLSVTAEFASLTSGSLRLLSGTKAGAYEFTLRVHDDPTADQTGGSGIAHVNNRFYPSGLTITIRGKAKNSPGTQVLVQDFIARPALGWTTWTTITLKGGLDFVDTDGDLDGSPALILSLSPTNAIDMSTGGKDVGSLLVSQPTLTFNP